MSSIIIRNIVGQGPFALPTSESEADLATTSLRSILDSIQWFYYNDARVLVIHPEQGIIPEMTFVIETYFYLGSVIPTTNALRTELRTVLLLNPDIISIGNIDIDNKNPGEIFYHQWPEIEWIDSQGRATVQFKDTIPAGAQIELAKYTRWKPGVHDTDLYTLDPHLGKRFHRFYRLKVGERSISLLPWVNQSGKFRNAFRARYVWPEPPGTLAPAHGIFGPLAPYGVVTATGTERDMYKTLLLMHTAPSRYKVL